MLPSDILTVQSSHMNHLPLILEEPLNILDHITNKLLLPFGFGLAAFNLAVCVALMSRILPPLRHSLQQLDEAQLHKGLVELLVGVNVE